MNTQAENNPAETEKINQIREILFGNNIAEFEKRFVDLENTYTNNLKQLEENHATRLKEAISGFEIEIATIRQELESIKNESNKYKEEAATLSDLLQANSKDFQKQISQLENRTVQADKLAGLFQQMAKDVDNK